MRLSHHSAKFGNFLFAQAARAISHMSVAEFETQDPALIADCDERQLVQYLERNRDEDGGFDISGLVGVERLSKSLRKELAWRLR